MAEDIPRAPASFEDCRRLTRRFEASFNLPLGVILARGVGAITGPYHDYESKKKTKNLMVNSLDLTHCDYDFFLFIFSLLRGGKMDLRNSIFSVFSTEYPIIRL